MAETRRPKRSASQAILAAFKYADYDADQYLTDTTKYWVQVDYGW